MPEYAHLNEEGMKQLGHIFPDGQVPIRSLLPSRGWIAEFKGEFLLADWNDMTDEQRGKLRAFMINHRGIAEGEFDDLLAESRMTVPLRSELVACASSDEPYKYL